MPKASTLVEENKQFLATLPNDNNIKRMDSVRLHWRLTQTTARLEALLQHVQGHISPEVLAQINEPLSGGR